MLSDFWSSVAVHREGLYFSIFYTIVATFTKGDSALDYRADSVVAYDAGCKIDEKLGASDLSSFSIRPIRLPFLSSLEIAERLQRPAAACSSEGFSFFG